MNATATTVPAAPMADLSLGETIARNIAREMTRLDWDYEELGEASGLGWSTVVSHRADVSGMPISDVYVIAQALGVSLVDLVTA